MYWTQFEEISYPFVIKPLGQSASRGVSIVHNESQLQPAIEKALAYCEAYVVQEYCHGAEHSVEMLLDGDTLRWFNIVDRKFRYENGIPMEIGHVNPSSLVPEQWDAIQAMMLRTAAAFGINWGPFKADVIWTASGPKILETTCRLSGGYDSAATSPAIGCDPTRALIQMACGLPVDPIGAPQGYAACAAAFPEPGAILYAPDEMGAILYTLVETSLQTENGTISYREYVQQMPGVCAVHLHKYAGDTIEEYQHCAARPAFVIAKGDTYDTAWQRAQAAADVLAEGYVTEVVA